MLEGVGLKNDMTKSDLKEHPLRNCGPQDNAHRDGVTQYNAAHRVTSDEKNHRKT